MHPSWHYKFPLFVILMFKSFLLSWSNMSLPLANLPNLLSLRLDHIKNSSLYSLCSHIVFNKLFCFSCKRAIMSSNQSVLLMALSRFCLIVFLSISWSWHAYAKGDKYLLTSTQSASGLLTTLWTKRCIFYSGNWDASHRHWMDQNNMRCPVCWSSRPGKHLTLQEMHKLLIMWKPFITYLMIS